MNLGLIGCGYFGKKWVSTLQSLTKSKLVAVCTTNPQNLLLWDESVQVFSTYQELCNQQLDGVIICTPPDTHVEIMNNCFDISMPFIIEKPVCLSLNDMIDIKWRSGFGLPCLVDYTTAFSPAFQTMLDKFKDVYGGHIISQAQSFGPFRKDVSMVWDWLPHDIAMILLSMQNEPIRLKMNYEQSKEYDNAGRIQAEIEFSNGTAIIDICNVSQQKMRYFGVNRGFDINNNSVFYKMENNNLTIYRGKEIECVKLEDITPLQNVIRHFEGCLKSKMQLGITLSVWITKIIEKMEFSNSMDGVWVKFA